MDKGVGVGTIDRPAIVSPLVAEGPVPDAVTLSESFRPGATVWRGGLRLEMIGTGVTDKVAVVLVVAPK